MAVKIRLKRMGKIRAPFYRVVVMDSRTKRDGRAIEEIGKYHPTEEPSLIEIDSERAQYWLGVGAQPTEQVAALLKVTGDWQRFKGLPGAEGTLKVRAPRADKRALYEAAIAAAGGTLAPKGGEATTARRKKAAEPQAEDTKPEDTKPEDTKPQDTKPQDTKPQDTKPQDTKPGEAPAGAEPPAPDRADQAEA